LAAKKTAVNQLKSKKNQASIQESEHGSNLIFAGN
jgi:hypothetical protein